MSTFIYLSTLMSSSAPNCSKLCWSFKSHLQRKYHFGEISASCGTKSVNNWQGSTSQKFKTNWFNCFSTISNEVTGSWDRCAVVASSWSWRTSTTRRGGNYWYISLRSKWLNQSRSKWELCTYSSVEKRSDSCQGSFSSIIFTRHMFI